MSTKILILDKNFEEIQKLINPETLPKENYQFSYVRESTEAIRIIGENDIDIVISDSSASRINGMEFLSVVHSLFPRTFRVLLTNSNEKERYISLVKIAHRFLKKPLNGEELVNTIIEYSNLKEYKLDAHLISKINGLCTIPALPDIYLRLDMEMNKASISINRIAEIISEDPLLVARIFHIAHSSFFNIPNGITDLLQSINFLGVNIVKTLVLYVKIFSLKNVSPETESALKKIRIHSINVAKLTKAIAEKDSSDREVIERAYITGLLHDVGKIVLLQLNEKQRHISYLNNIDNFNSPDFERNAFGISHIDVGAYILNLWKFPREIIEAVASHHDSSLMKNKALSLKHALFIANLFSNKFDDMAVRLAKNYGIDKLNEWNQLMNDGEQLGINPARE